MHRITNKKGQALIEFVIILPVVLMILFVIIDFSNIFYQKNHLENVVSDVASLKENGKSNKYIEKTKKPIGNSISSITNAELIRAFDMLT